MEPYGITTFCDDIRFEQHGKISLIGCYGHELIVFSEFPVVLPKLCVFVQLRFPSTTISSVKILIYFPGDEDGAPTILQDLPPPEEVALKLPEQANDKDLQRQISLNHFIIISPMLLKQHGRIKVRAMLNDQIVRVGTLKITTKPEEST